MRLTELPGGREVDPKSIGLPGPAQHYFPSLRSFSKAAWSRSPALPRGAPRPRGYSRGPGMALADLFGTGWMGFVCKTSPDLQTCPV